MPTIPSPVRLTTSRAVIGQFYLALENDTGASWVGDVSPAPFSSDQESETYAWLGQTPKLREWIGGRQAQGLMEQGFTIRNKKYESTLELPVDWMRRDKTGQILMRINEQAEAANDHWAELLSTLIEAGEASACYDGQYFFDTDHAEEDSGSQSNDLTYDVSTTTAPTTVEMSGAILAATQGLLGLKDGKGRYLNANARAFTVMVPLSFMGAAAAALGSTVIADTVSRTNTLITLGALGGFQYRLAINPRLSWTTKFALFRTGGKALVRQEELAVQMAAQAEGSPAEFERDVHQYGIKTNRNVGYGYWQHAALTTLT
jgi:hypothetical protein